LKDLPVSVVQSRLTINSYLCDMTALVFALRIEALLIALSHSFLLSSILIHFCVHLDKTFNLLSSGMCTEVFQFDTSSSARDISMEERQNGTRLHRNRRILNGPPVSLSRPSHSSGEQTGTDGKRENFSRNKSLSSLVVSVLVDGDGDGIMGPKSVSRIFIVVLIDSVKYVTYSCMLPFIDSVHVAEAS